MLQDEVAALKRRVSGLEDSVAELGWECGALREICEAAGVAYADQLAARRHRVSFARTLAEHPLGATETASTALSVGEVARLVGKVSGSALGVAVVCRAERSQHKNRDKAMKMLRAKLYQIELDKRLEAQAEVNAQKKGIDFGSQIRSYVMQPYQLVKDLRTGETNGDVGGVLNGNLQKFMETWLAARAEGTLSEG